MKYCELKQKLSRDRIYIYISTVSAIVFGIIAHAYGLLNANYSHDSLNEINAAHAEDYMKIWVGRFFVPVLRWFRSSFDVIWLIGLIGFVFIGISSYIICVKLFECRNKVVICMVSAVMVTNIVVSTQIATFSHEFDFNMLALLFSTIAAYFLKICDKPGNRALGYLLSLILLALSMGIYQAYIGVAVCLIILTNLYNLIFEKDTYAHCIKKCIISAITVIASVLMYFAIVKIITHCFSMELAERIVPINTLDKLFENIFETIYRIYKAFIKNDFAVSTVPQKLYEIINYSVICFAAIVVLYRIWHNGIKKIKESLLIVALCVGIPFSLDIPGYVSSEGTHILVLYPICLIWIFAIIVSFNVKSLTERCGKFVKNYICFAMIIIIFNNVTTANILHEKKDLQFRATQSLMTRVLSDLEHRDDYEIGKTKLCFTGTGPLIKNIPGFESTEHIICSNSRFLTTDDIELIEYFTYYLQYPVNLVLDEERASLISKANENGMVKFPKSGYIKNINGTLVINLGNSQYDWYCIDEDEF